MGARSMAVDLRPLDVLARITHCVGLKQQLMGLILAAPLRTSDQNLGAQAAKLERRSARLEFAESRQRVVGRRFERGFSVYVDVD